MYPQIPEIPPWYITGMAKRHRWDWLKRLVIDIFCEPADVKKDRASGQK